MIPNHDHSDPTRDIFSPIDPLTKIFNRVGFYQAIDPVVHGNTPNEYTIIVCNIRNFKVINEVYGEKIGDQVLISVAQHIASGAPVACGRLDADRFVLCIHRRELDIDQILKTSKRTFESEGLSFPYSIRFGIYVVKDTSLSINAMCDRAKAAIRFIRDEYYKPYSIWDESMREEIINEELFFGELQPALDDRQFTVFYQPIVDAKTGDIVSAESLVRWNHPEKGWISPGKFIPVFEKNASIAKLDFFVGTTVAVFLRKRWKKGLPIVPISVNSSRMDFHNHDIPYLVQAFLKRIDLPAKYVRLEITESAFAVEPDKLFADLSRLRDSGVLVLLDDFGSGYSSFNTLHRIDIDILKIDMKFFDHFPTNPKCRIIISSIIQMAHQLGNKVVAEGVETQEEYLFLRDAHCDFIQGYYFYKPMA